MVNKRIYLDNAATTPVDPRVKEAILPYFSDKFGNPSSIHSFGQETKAAIEKAREQVVGLIGGSVDEIVFTSGGTEADNFALEGVAFANEAKGKHIITSSIEHHAVLECCKFLEKRGFSVTYLPVDESGVVSPESVVRAITDKTILVSIMQANNEIGTIEPIGEIAKAIKMRNAELGIRSYFHTDAVQTAGHIPVNVNELGVDLLSISAHKLYGPKGVGALYIRKGTKITPFLHGGGQERGRRASTENVPGIVGFGAAAEIAAGDVNNGESKKLIPLRDKLINGILEKITDARLNGHLTQRLPNNVNVSINYVEGESMLLNLDLEGIAASTGSACSSGSLEPSHVLRAIGLPYEQAHGSLRFSLGKNTTEAEIDKTIEVLRKIVLKLREMSPLKKGGK
ncbi:MAG: cysteine desulfurase NifS [Candidatus Margulisbacteria bacterium]|nr:cysteine desulfurase NifS [Candidatus Margulisiibacteriota bacterium]